MRANPITLATWTAYGDDYARLHVGNPKHPLHYRLHWLACSRANAAGHAEFGMGELLLALALPDCDGVSHTPYASSVSKAIKDAKELGLLHASSSARCLVLPYGVQRGGTGSQSCVHHGIRPRRRLS